MLNITTKTTRHQLITEIELRGIELRTAKAAHEREIAELQAKHKEALEGLAKRVEALEESQAVDIADRDHAERRCELLAEDVSNLLGTIRVLSDPQRPIRIRMSTVERADIGTALPRHNTDKL